MTQNIPNAQIPDNSESSLFATMAFHNEPEFVLAVQPKSAQAVPFPSFCSRNKLRVLQLSLYGCRHIAGF